MITRFRGKRITAMLGILPQTIGYFDDEVDNYSFLQNRRCGSRRLWVINSTDWQRRALRFLILQYMV